MWSENANGEGWWGKWGRRRKDQKSRGGVEKGREEEMEQNEMPMRRERERVRVEMKGEGREESEGMKW